MFGWIYPLTSSTTLNFEADFSIWQLGPSKQHVRTPKWRCEPVYLLHTPAWHTLRRTRSRMSYTWGSESGLCRAGSGPSSARSSSLWCGRRPRGRRPDTGLCTGSAPFQTCLEEKQKNRGVKSGDVELWLNFGFVNFPARNSRQHEVIQQRVNRVQQLKLKRRIFHQKWVEIRSETTTE